MKYIIAAILTAEGLFVAGSGCTPPRGTDLTQGRDSHLRPERSTVYVGQICKGQGGDAEVMLRVPGYSYVVVCGIKREGDDSPQRRFPLALIRGGLEDDSQ